MATKMQPVTFRWDPAVGSAGAMLVHGRFKRLAVGQFGAGGGDFILEVHEVGSSKSRAHFFATINEVWHSLPEKVATRFPSSEHLRKWAMIQCGYADETTLACPSKRMAAMAAGFIRQGDAYSVIRIADDDVVHRWSATSVRRMKKDQFQKMKDDVLSLVTSMVGTTPKKAERAGRFAPNPS